jgi:hypothetical protein
VTRDHLTQRVQDGGILGVEVLDHFITGAVTNPLPVEVTCYVCNQASTQILIASYYNVGSPDLDTRPPEMQRSTLPHWVQVCPHCGYVAFEISEGTDATPLIIRSDDYRAQLTDPAYPELANRFLCWALAQEQQGKFIGAGWSSVHAARAWIPTSGSCRFFWMSLPSAFGGEM